MLFTEEFYTSSIVPYIPLKHAHWFQIPFIWKLIEGISSKKQNVAMKINLCVILSVFYSNISQKSYIFFLMPTAFLINTYKMHNDEKDSIQNYFELAFNTVYALFIKICS